MGNFKHISGIPHGVIVSKKIINSMVFSLFVQLLFTVKYRYNHQ